MIIGCVDREQRKWDGEARTYQPSLGSDALLVTGPPPLT